MVLTAVCHIMSAEERQRRSLRSMKVEEELEKEKQRIVVIPEEIVAEARRPIERMLELSL